MQCDYPSESLMKYSLYNSLLSVNPEQSLLYNATSDKFVYLKPNAEWLLRTLSPEQLKDEHPALFSKLQEVDAVVDDSVDEAEELRKGILKSVNDEEFVELQVNPTVDCNFRCWYCYENHVKGSRMQPEMERRVEGLMDRMAKEHPAMKHFHLSFFGGEPLMYFKTVARPLIEHLKAVCGEHGAKMSVHFTSNAFLLNQTMLDTFRGLDVSFQITLDGGKAHHDRTRFMPNGKGSFDVIVQHVRQLVDAGHRVILRINYTGENVRSISDIAEALSDWPKACFAHLNIDLQRVWQDSDNRYEDDEVSNLIKQHIHTFTEMGISVSYHKVMVGARNVCYADRRNCLLVNYNGDVFKCTARDFSRENRSGILNEASEVEWKEGILEHRERLVFNRSECHRCRIAPLCGGGCSQRALERESMEGCLYDYSEEDMDNMILDRFEYMFLN